MMIKDKSDLVPSTLTEGSERSERRMALQTTADRYVEAIQEQVGDLKTVGKNALIIGGVVLVGYFLTELLLPNADEESTEPTEPRRNKADIEGDSMMLSMIKGVATTVLLAIAKERLMKLIEGLPENEPTTTDNN
jgi:tRNA A37 N6-isopentenylltransferase MiaA